MGFDVLLASGKNNTLFPGNLMDCLVEVRVEQSLDAPTKFAVRFLDDIEKGKMMKESVAQLQIGEIVTVAVADGDGYTGLVRGPILKTKSNMTLGGIGSSFEVHGIDRRDELARDYKELMWAGTVTNVARVLLAPIYPVMEVGKTTEAYDFIENQLPQRGSDLDFLTKNAAENGFHFWITYEGVKEIPPNKLLLIEKVHWTESPPLQKSPPGGLPPVIPFGKKPVTIRYHVPQDQCPNVTKFDLSKEGDRPSEVRTSTRNTSDGGQDAVTTIDDTSKVGGKGKGLGLTAPVRFMPPKPQGNAQTTRTINQAALREAGFYVRAEVATTRYLLTGILQPHQVVGVEGIGGRNGETPFRVEEVTHVINGQAHFIQAKMATNAEVDV